MQVKIVKEPITREELRELASNGFKDIIKAVVDVRQGIMAVGGELHADEEVMLVERAGSKREDTWGVNLYVDKRGDEFIEFDSMINIKPSLGNRSRGVDDQDTREKIKEVIGNLIS